MGKGGQGSVFKVTKKGDESGKVYAAKTYHTEYGQCHIDETYQNEIELYNVLPETPMLGHLVDHFDEGKRKILVMELIKGH